MSIAKAVTAFVAFLLLQWFNIPVPVEVQLTLEALLAALAVWAVPNKQ